jgi:hypothetical protein
MPAADGFKVVGIRRKTEASSIDLFMPLSERPEPGPINLQDHQAEVRYRNVWFVEK